MDPIDKAYALTNQHRVGDAIATLESAGKSGNASCWMELASWYLSGQLVDRDLSRARDCFRLAGETGNQRARMIYISLLANGTGGPSDWSVAVDELRRLAATDRDAAEQVDLLDRMALGPSGEPLELPSPQALSESPEVILVPSLLSADECDYLVQSALPFLQPSVVVDPGTGQMRAHPVRTSDNAVFPWVDENPVIHAINRRIAAASHTPVEAGEPLQILRYRPSQEYRPHHDALPGSDNQRVLTMLVYLNDDYSGGETLFLSTGLKVKGSAGDALLFRNANARGQPDPMAQHAGLPVTSGEKLIASRWIHERRFGPL